MDIKTRIATLEDLEEIYQIERVCFETSDIFHKETFEFFLTTHEVIFFMCLRIILQQFHDIGHEFILVEWFGHIFIRSLFQSPEAIAVLRFAG